MLGVIVSSEIKIVTLAADLEELSYLPMTNSCTCVMLSNPCWDITEQFDFLAVNVKTKHGIKKIQLVY